MKRIIICIFICIFLLVGCQEKIVYRYVENSSCPEQKVIKETVIVNNTIYINNTTNTTSKCQPSNTTNTTTKYVLDLIKRIKRCEAMQVKNWNISECEWELEKCNESLMECNESLQTIKDALD